MAAVGHAPAPSRPASPASLVVAVQELRDLWVGGHGLPLMVAFSLLVGATTYLVASNRALNFLEQREAVNLTLQIAVAVASLLVLLGAGDAISGERERATLETLLLTPVSRRAIVLGKGLAALSLWVAAFAVTVPYVWLVARGIDLVGVALVAGFAVGALLALFLAGLGLTVSAVAGSNRLSLSLSLIVLLALYAPTQMPTAAQHGWAGDFFLRVDPFSAGLHYLGKVVVDGHGAGQDASWLLSPLIAATLAVAAALAVAGRLSIRSGDRA
jgi:ABC-2 type transport system permease protein